MNQTFEEFAGRHIDSLYHGTLFLTVGEETPAEELVLWTLTGGFQEFRQIEKGDSWDRWIEGKLVEVFLARVESGSPDQGSTYAVSDEDPTIGDGPTKDFSGDDALVDDDGVEGSSMDGSRTEVPSSHEPSAAAMEIDHEVLFRSGADMPPLARAAIWLVLFRRWPYGEATEVLKTDVDGLKDLLRYRQLLLSAVVWGSVDRNGTDHGLRH